MARQQAHLLLFMIYAILLQSDAFIRTCGSNEMKCKDGRNCVNLIFVCDGGQNCNDYSDEDSELCSIWRFRNYGSRSSVEVMCRNPGDTNQRFCEVFRSGKLELPPPPQEGMSINNDISASLSAAVNSTLDRKLHDCPMLYTKIGDTCLALFSPAKVPWAEARQFCHSIYGELVHFNAVTYVALLDYMKTAGLTSSYWVGGRFDLDTNAWAWVHDDSPMPLGSPFWTLTYSSSCERRSPPHTDPFSSPPDPLPGAACHHYKQSPSNRAQGWCSAMTYEMFYYVSEEKCQETHSPLCVLTTP